jgi:hypothetical protein
MVCFQHLQLWQSPSPSRPGVSKSFSSGKVKSTIIENVSCICMNFVGFQEFWSIVIGSLSFIFTIMFMSLGVLYVSQSRSLVLAHRKSKFKFKKSSSRSATTFTASLLGCYTSSVLVTHCILHLKSPKCWLAHWSCLHVVNHLIMCVTPIAISTSKNLVFVVAFCWSYWTCILLIFSSAIWCFSYSV